MQIMTLSRKVFSMAIECPKIGFAGATDLSAPGMPMLGTPFEVWALLHNLSPKGYASQPGQVAFRWAPFGFPLTGNYCSLPLLTAAPGTTNPAQAIDPADNNTLIAPGNGLPASFMWLPDTKTVGIVNSGSKAKGQIVCQATALNDGVCGEVDSDCSDMLPSSFSVPISVYASASSMMAAGDPFLAERTGAPLQLHFGFAIPNSRGIGIRVKVRAISLGKLPIPKENIAVQFGKANSTILVGFPSPFTDSVYAGTVPKPVFEDLIHPTDLPDAVVDLHPRTIRQGLLSVTVPQGAEMNSSIIHIIYEDARDNQSNFGSFTINITEEVISMMAIMEIKLGGGRQPGAI